jgi:hypothetical protein
MAYVRRCPGTSALRVDAAWECLLLSTAPRGRPRRRYRLRGLFEGLFSRTPARPGRRLFPGPRAAAVRRAEAGKSARRKRRLAAVFTVKTRPKLRLGKTCDRINSLQRLNVLKRARRLGWSPWPRNQWRFTGIAGGVLTRRAQEGSAVLAVGRSGGSGQSSGRVNRRIIRLTWRPG